MAARSSADALSCIALFAVSLVLVLPGTLPLIAQSPQDQGESAALGNADEESRPEPKLLQVQVHNFEINALQLQELELDWQAILSAPLDEASIGFVAGQPYQNIKAQPQPALEAVFDEKSLEQIIRTLADGSRKAASGPWFKIKEGAWGGVSSHSPKQFFGGVSNASQWQSEGIRVIFKPTASEEGWKLNGQ